MAAGWVGPPRSTTALLADVAGLAPQRDGQPRGNGGIEKGGHSLAAVKVSCVDAWSVKRVHEFAIWGLLSTQDGNYVKSLFSWQV